MRWWPVRKQRGENLAEKVKPEVTPTQSLDQSTLMVKDPFTLLQQ
jgi:hypothetical protein